MSLRPTAHARWVLLTCSLRLGFLRAEQIRAALAGGRVDAKVMEGEDWTPAGRGPGIRTCPSSGPACPLAVDSPSVPSLRLSPSPQGTHSSLLAQPCPVPNKRLPFVLLLSKSSATHFTEEDTEAQGTESQTQTFPFGQHHILQGLSPQP